MTAQSTLTRAREFYAGPIIVLSARDKEAEKIAALDLGANDYVEKPFGVGELLARLRAGLRAVTPEVLGPIDAGDISIDLEHRRVRRAGTIVRLTPKEFDVLAHLARHRGKVIGHRDLLSAVWGAAHMRDTQYLRVVVGQLRQKLEIDPSAPTLLLTEPGVGYRLEA